MNLIQIECLVGVVRFGGYDRAAEVLHLSSSAVAKNVKKIEDEFGITLMDREGRRSIPTLAAIELADKASAVLRAFHDFEHRLESLTAEVVVKEGIPIAVSGSRLRSCCLGKEDLDSFFLERGGFDFRRSERPNEVCFAGLQAGVFDIAVTIGNRPIPGVSYRRIGSLTAMAKVSKAHRLAEKPVLSFSDLEGQDIAEPDDFAFVRTQIHSRLVSRGISASFVDIPFSASSYRSFVASGGLVFVGPYCTLFDDEVVLSFGEQDAVSFPIFLAWRDCVSQSLIDDLAGFLARIVATRGSDFAFGL
ncbi:MAG: LysR family transcriptional regulator [Slackia sp.]|nr:LysR family transcriptional regulator [Slackia sp.]